MDDDDDGSSDPLLVTKARNGSIHAFERLVERYHPAVLRYLIRQTRDRELAADIAQDTFFDAFRHLDQLLDDTAFSAWLYKIARNNLLMEWRRGKLRHDLSLDWLPALDSVSSPDGTDSSNERDLIGQVFASLSPTLREALVLHALWGLQSSQVAQLLGITPAAARQRIGRARKEFRVLYEELNGVAGGVR